jgi:uncharacterized protein YbjT (DUF2867 family)
VHHFADRERVSVTATTKYLITGAGGGMGGVSPRVVQNLLSHDAAVRALVHREDSRAETLRELGAEVIVGDLTNPVDVAAAVCASAEELDGLDVLVNMSQMTVSQMTATSTEESRQQRLHWLAEHVINWSGVPAVHIRPTVFLDNPFFTVLAARSIRETGRLALPFGSGRTSPVAATDVADVVTAVLRAPDEHLGAVYELTGPAALDIDGLAGQYAKALDRPITALRLPYDEWLERLTQEGTDPHAQQHIATMARLHRDDRYNRLTHDVEDLTGRPAQSVEEYIRQRRDLFT